VVTKRPKVEGSKKWEFECSEVKCSEGKWSEDLWWNVCIIIDLQLCSFTYVLCSTLCHYDLLLFV